MAMPSPSTETVVGLVEQVTSAGTGIRVGGEWLNYSRPHPDVLRPIRGQRISAQVQRTERGLWIAGLEVLDGGAVQFPRRPGGSGRPQSDPRTITRLAVLKAAGEFRRQPARHEERGRAHRGGSVARVGRAELVAES